MNRIKSRQALEHLKTISILCACLVSSGLSTPAQAQKADASITQKPVDKPIEKRRTPRPPAKTNGTKQVEYSGYIVEVFRAEKKRSLFDLSTPLDPQKEAANVFWSGRPDMAQPIILFRITPKR